MDHGEHRLLGQRDGRDEHMPQGQHDEHRLLGQHDGHKLPGRLDEHDEHRLLGRLDGHMPQGQHDGGLGQQHTHDGRKPLDGHMHVE